MSFFKRIFGVREQAPQQSSRPPEQAPQQSSTPLEQPSQQSSKQPAPTPVASSVPPSAAMKGGGQQELQFFNGFLSGLSPDKQEHLKAFFQGLGNDEMMAIYGGDYCRPAIQRIGNFVDPRKDRIKMAARQSRDGYVVYIRGTIGRADLLHLLSEIRSCMKDTDEVLVPPSLMS